MGLKVGICGFGGLGHMHANALATMADVEITAVCDARAEQLKAKEVKFNIDTGKKQFDISRCRTYDDFGKMLKKEKPDVVVTALPTDLHAKTAIQALRAGCHVFSEKPMALNVKECDKMLRARDRAQRQLMIGQCLRFWPEYEALLRAIKEKTYGPLLSLSMERIGEYSKWSDGNWFNDVKRSGGAMLDLHLHDVDWVQHALGRPAGIWAAGIIGKTGGYDDITAVWEYAGGPMVSIRCSWLHTGFTMNFRAMFEQAVLDYGIPPDPALRVKFQDQKEWQKVDVPTGSGYTKELRYFLDCVQGKQTNTICTPESTRESIAFIEIERKSILKKKRIALTT